MNEDIVRGEAVRNWRDAAIAHPLLGEMAGVRAEVDFEIIAMAQSDFGLFSSEDSFSFAFDKSAGFASVAAGAEP